MNSVLEASERRTAEHGQLVEKISREIAALGADHAARGVVIDDLKGRSQAAEVESAGRLEAIEDLDRQVRELAERLTGAEVDRTEREALIEKLSGDLAERERGLAAVHAAMAAMAAGVLALETDRARRGAVIEELNDRTLAAEAASAGRLEAIEDLDRQVQELAERLTAAGAEHSERDALINRLSGDLAERERGLAAVHSAMAAEVSHA